MNPRQRVVLRYDAYRLLGEALRDEPGVVIDGGANVGEATRALRSHMPQAEIHAFEPVGVAFERLRDVCREVDATAHRSALGDERGEIEINVNKNLWTCSILDANERGHAFHDDWCETVRQETVGVERLDAWARERGAEEIALLKLDLQGYELRALRGAGDLLERTRAVYSEAQITPEYRGAATFGEIDGYLRGRGFGLYQMIDLCLKGTHMEPSCCDGIWLREDVLARVRSRGTPDALRRDARAHGVTMSAALDRCAQEGLSRVALYGAGAHTVSSASALATPPVEIAFIIDDARAGGRMWGLPIVTRDDAMDRAVDAIILSSDSVEELLFQRSTPFLERGVAIVRLYGEGGVRLARREEVDSMESVR